MKIKCPHCGSNNIVYWEEILFTFEHRMTKKGRFSKRRTKQPGGTSEVNYGYKCKDCGAYVSCNSGDSYEWES